MQLTTKECDMVTMLIEGFNISDIAKTLNITRQTVYNWMNKDYIKAELDRRRQELAHQGNQLILKDLTTYIGKIKELAQDTSDKRVCLAANQYLLNRIYGNPTNVLETNNEDNNDNINETELEQELNRFKKLKVVK